MFNIINKKIKSFSIIQKSKFGDGFFSDDVLLKWLNSFDLNSEKEKYILKRSLNAINWDNLYIGLEEQRRQIYNFFITKYPYYAFFKSKNIQKYVFISKFMRDLKKMPSGLKNNKFSFSPYGGSSLYKTGSTGYGKSINVNWNPASTKWFNNISGDSIYLSHEIHKSELAISEYIVQTINNKELYPDKKQDINNIVVFFWNYFNSNEYKNRKGDERLYLLTNCDFSSEKEKKKNNIKIMEIFLLHSNSNKNILHRETKKIL